mgnify:CR=1 FL=1
MPRKAPILEIGVGNVRVKVYDEEHLELAQKLLEKYAMSSTSSEVPVSQDKLKELDDRLSTMEGLLSTLSGIEDEIEAIKGELKSLREEVEMVKRVLKKREKPRRSGYEILKEQGFLFKEDLEKLEARGMNVQAFVKSLVKQGAKFWEKHGNIIVCHPDSLMELVRKLNDNEPLTDRERKAFDVLKDMGVLYESPGGVWDVFDVET